MKKVPCEGRTRYNDEAGKTRTALLKKRTDQGLSDASSKVKQFQCCHRSLIFSSTMNDESPTANFIILMSSPMRNFFSYQLIPKAKKAESQSSSQMKKFTILLEVNNKQALSKKQATI